MSEEASAGVAFAWINRLPDEILSEIFVYTYDIRLIDPDSRPVHRQGPPSGAFLSHVCQRWRNVALSCQYLWASLPCETIEWTKACLARAHSGPVTLRFNPLWNADTVNPLLLGPRRLIYPAIPRARVINAWLEFGRPENTNAYTSEVLQALTQEAPWLEELEITLDRPMDFGSNEPRFVPTLFGEKPPHKLRRVYLEGCALNFPPTIFTAALTVLQLGESRLWTNMDEMIEFLWTVPLLQDFSFTYSGDLIPYGIDAELSRTHPPRCISLPHLRSWQVSTSFVVGIRMFSYFAFSPDAELRIMVDDGESGEPDAQRYTDAELEGLIAFGSTAVRAHYAEYSQHGGHYDSIELGYRSISHDPWRMSLSIPDVDAHDAHRLRAAAAAMYLSIPVFADAETLTIRSGWRGFSWDDMLCCENVKRLHFGGIAILSFEIALREREMPSHPLFPACSEIAIRDFNFAEWPGQVMYDIYTVPADFEVRLVITLRLWQADRDSERNLQVNLDNCALGPETMGVFQSAFGKDYVHTS
ncbi:unnamed protein product [Peniophora sp. CBMAI 1063]|nr:unnamed protein product [Peniophora sp. CBMAI 1063]